MYLPLFICLSLCLSAGSQKGVDDFLMKWFGRVGYVFSTSGLDDPDHGVDSEIFNRNFNIVIFNEFYSQLKKLKTNSCGFLGNAMSH